MSFTKFLESQKLIKTIFNNDHEYTDDYQEETVDIGTATTISSETHNGTHKILLDLDVPHHYEPSSTPGHGHLYIDVELKHGNYMLLMFLLKYLGVIQEGYFNQIIVRGHNNLRLPWIKKDGGPLQAGL